MCGFLTYCHVFERKKEYFYPNDVLRSLGFVCDWTLWLRRGTYEGINPALDSWLGLTSKALTTLAGIFSQALHMSSNNFIGVC